jgi:hypothetical protein
MERRGEAPRAWRGVMLDAPVMRSRALPMPISATVAPGSYCFKGISVRLHRFVECGQLPGTAESPERTIP